MSASRFLRPLARALPRQPVIQQSAIVRPAAIASFSTQTRVSQPTKNAPAKITRVALPEEKKAGKMVALQSAMPQLIPFFFVNEVTFAWILLPTLIYVFSKYLLPQKVRLMAARMFISKL
ncbi:hypothetical protein EJ05DRAFT_500426 [Pseudovirgaria hyperparasitica]|uniref:ATP synthase protein 8 n=1 Tax=Pseudovirgaria hyperparasitica TaxID=470096 RepID=A0A6A6W4U9_9PEZI|nr:uncharacterized protein EJ05DRAFT_500426 [Pseudovirgaria hyperparasitica]KAF2757902.1 hypothetical protein EJ05DRAFT_500426 [Pseudovirgaria hyperparasitica]